MFLLHYLRLDEPPSTKQDEVKVEETNVKAPEHQIMLPLEERITHFRDMLLERGVRNKSALT